MGSAFRLVSARMLAGFIFAGVAGAGPCTAARAQAAPSPAATAPAKAAALLIRPFWEKDAKATFEFNFVSNQDAILFEENAPSGRSGQRSEMSGRITRTVSDVTAEGTKLIFTIEQLALQMTTGQSVVRFDSAKPMPGDEQNPLKPQVMLVVGRPITVHLDVNGKITKIENNTDPDPKNEEEARRPRIPRAVVGDEVIKNAWRPLYSFPARERAAHTAAFMHAPGSSWTSSDRSTPQGLGTMDVAFTHTLSPGATAPISIATKGVITLTPGVGPGSVTTEVSAQTVDAVTLIDLAPDGKGASLRAFASQQLLDFVGTNRAGVKRRVQQMQTAHFALLSDLPSGQTAAKLPELPSLPPSDFSQAIKAVKQAKPNVPAAPAPAAPGVPAPPTKP